MDSPPEWEDGTEDMYGNHRGLSVSIIHNQVLQRTGGLELSIKQGKYFYIMIYSYLVASPVNTLWKFPKNRDHVAMFFSLYPSMQQLCNWWTNKSHSIERDEIHYNKQIKRWYWVIVSMEPYSARIQIPVLPFTSCTSLATLLLVPQFPSLFLSHGLWILTTGDIYYTFWNLESQNSPQVFLHYSLMIAQIPDQQGFTRKQPYECLWVSDSGKRNRFSNYFIPINWRGSWKEKTEKLWAAQCPPKGEIRSNFMIHAGQIKSWGLCWVLGGTTSFPRTEALTKGQTQAPRFWFYQAGPGAICTSVSAEFLKAEKPISSPLG